MLIELLISGVVILGSIIFVHLKKGSSISFQLPQLEAKEELSDAQKLRRQQQSLRRHQKDLETWEGQLSHQTQLLELDTKNLMVNNNILSLREEGLSLQDRENALKQGFRMLELGNKELKIATDSERVASEKRLLKLLKISLSQQEKQIELKDKQSQVAHGARMNQLRGEQLTTQEQKLLHAYNIKSFQLETMLQNIVHQFRDLQLERKSFGLFKQQSNLQVYQNRLNNLRTHIDQMFKVKSEWLRLQAKEHNLNNREEKIQLRNLYDTTQQKIKELAVVREETDLHWDRRALDFQKQTLRFIGKNW